MEMTALREHLTGRVQLPEQEKALARVISGSIAIGENPGRGHRIESSVFLDLRGIVVKQSLICYRILPDRVQIVRILEVRQDRWTILKGR
jgi:plasmid stabilization system protein ParE